MTGSDEGVAEPGDVADPLDAVVPLADSKGDDAGLRADGAANPDTRERSIGADADGEGDADGADPGPDRSWRDLRGDVAFPNSGRRIFAMLNLRDSIEAAATATATGASGVTWLLLQSMRGGGDSLPTLNTSSSSSSSGMTDDEQSDGPGDARCG